MEFLIGVVLSLFASWITFEIGLRYKNWCVVLIEMAAHRVADVAVREIKREEWLAHLNDVNGIAAISMAIGCVIGARAVGRYSAPGDQKVVSGQRMSRIIQLLRGADAKSDRMLAMLQAMLDAGDRYEAKLGHRYGWILREYINAIGLATDAIVKIIERAAEALVNIARFISKIAR